MYIYFCILFIALFFSAFSVWVLWTMKRSVEEVERAFRKSLKVLEEEREQKRALLRELATLSLRFVSPQEIERVEKATAALDQLLSAERGKGTIVQAEVEAVDVRLRELEEIERELESTGHEASRELETLRRQEKEIAESNRTLKVELDSALLQLERLVADLSHSKEAVGKLKALETELLSTQEKNRYYTQEIAALNGRYVELKRAYDALDIEYAQLYEKQSAA